MRYKNRDLPYGCVEDFETFINHNPEAPPFKTKYKYQQHALIEFLFQIQRNITKFEDWSNPDGYVSLHSEILTIIRDDYWRYTEAARKAGIIETNNSYWVGEKTKEYRFTSKYQGRRLKTYQIKSKRAVRKINNYGIQLFRRLTPEQQQRRLYLDLLNIDLGLAYHIIKTRQPKKCPMYYASSKGHRKNCRHCKKEWAFEIRQQLKSDCRAIRDKEFYLTADNYGREHTNLTRLPRELRAAWNFNGKGVPKCWDVPCSQPFFSVAWLKGRVSDTELKRYYVDVMGDFYENFRKQWLLRFPDKPIGRTEAKTVVFKVFFDWARKNDPYHRVFNMMYPEVYRAMMNYKKWNGKSKLATELQGIEAGFIFGICDGLQYPLFTIHDAIYVEPENKSDLIEKCKQHYNSRINIYNRYLGIGINTYII